MVRIELVRYGGQKLSKLARNWVFMANARIERCETMHCDARYLAFSPLPKNYRRDLLEFLINRDDAKNIRTGRKFGKFGGC